MSVLQGVDIKIGEYDLIGSYTIITIENNPIKITLEDEIEGDFTFLINFIIDKKNKESISTYTIIDKHTLQIDFKNFDGFFGGGNTELISLGTLKKLPLFFNYRVFDLVNVGKTVILNFYLKKDSTNGN